jgi:hypothetical protein
MKHRDSNLSLRWPFRWVINAAMWPVWLIYAICLLANKRSNKGKKDD